MLGKLLPKTNIFYFFRQNYRNLYLKNKNVSYFCSNKVTEPGKSESGNNSSPQKVETINKFAMQQQEDDESLEQKIHQEMMARMKQLEKLHKQTQQMIDSKLKFPLKLCGTKDKYSTKYGYLPERILSYYRIPKARINDYLLKMFKASLYAIADRNTQYMDEYWEKGLKQSVLVAIDKATSQKFNISVQKDQNFLENISESCEIIDAVMFRGLSLDRQENKNPSEYVKYAEPDQVGLITYTPKNLTDNNQTFIDPKKNKTAYQGYEKMLLRVLVRIKTPLRVNISELNVPQQVQTWEHLCIMQNQMVAPKHLQSSYKLQTLMQWMGKYRFGPWRIADIDNYMKGNSPFRERYPKDEEELDPIFKGTKLDRSSYIDIRMI